MILSDLADYLATNGIGTVGTDIFITEVPETAGNTVMVDISNMEDQDADMDIRRATIDIWCRNAQTQAGNDKLEAVSYVIDRKGNFPMGQYYVYFAHTTNIEDPDEDNQGRTIFRMQLKLIYRLLNPTN